MARRDIGTRWDRENRNNINENFKELYDVQDRALRNSEYAVATAGQAVETANQALQNSESTQTQLDNIIIENGQSDAEVVQARTKADGTTFPVLRDRLNDVDDKIGILNKKTDSVISVKEFGAKGDGVTDDTVSIQNAINEAISKNMALFFPNGTYKVSDPDGDKSALRIVNATNFYMYSNGGATISVSNTFWGGMFDFVNCNNVTVTGFIFEGNGDGAVNSNAGNVALRFTRETKNIHVSKNMFRGFTDSAMTIISQSPYPDESGLSVSDTTRANAIITNNHFIRCEHCLITKYGGTRNTVIANNIVYQCAFGFKIDGESFQSYVPYTWKDMPTLSGNTIITGNVFSELDPKDDTQIWSGLGAVVLEENVENVIISNNIMSDFRNVSGVAISGGQGDRIFRNITISNNKMTNFNTSQGITITSGADKDIEGIVIEGNTFRKFNAGVIRIEAKKGIKGLVIKNNEFRDICQNTPFIGQGYFYPTDIGVFIVNKTSPNTYYANGVLIKGNEFNFTDSTTFNELFFYFVLDGFKVAKHEDVVIEDNRFIRPYTTTAGTAGISFSNVDKILVKNNYFESGRTYSKHCNILYKGNKFYGHRLALGAGQTAPTPVTIKDCEFISNGNGLDEWGKIENNTTLTIENITQIGMFATAYSGSTIVNNLFGTWTPTLSNDANDTNHTYNKRVGSWTRRGKEVTVHFRIELSALSAGSGGFVKIKNLPFPVVSFSETESMFVGNCVISSVNIPDTQRQIVPYVVPGANEIRLALQGDNTALSLLDYTAITNISSFWGSVTYLTN
ncbi:glycosyl hydrolase family 28-related protein [Aeribacillus sp. FSL K6-8394]|uniref:glycosyl hydrolase family 28-related protein n=1 Tax=Aeribacillus sp. FSL K6-8394 TaxID=2954570 RepID=UPI0030F64AC6